MDVLITRDGQAGQNPKYIPLPYVQGLSEKLSGILKPFNIKIAPRNENNFSNFFKLAKDHISKLDTADVVYNIPCTGLHGILHRYNQMSIKN